LLPLDRDQPQHELVGLFQRHAGLFGVIRHRQSTLAKQIDQGFALDPRVKN
jgi:hypothetical protein